MLIKITIGEIVKGKLPETTIELPPSTNSYDIKIVAEGIYGAILKAQSGIHSDIDRLTASAIEGSPVLAFFSDRTLPIGSPDEACTVNDLYEAFKDYIATNFPSWKVPTRSHFTEDIQNLASDSYLPGFYFTGLGKKHRPITGDKKTAVNRRLIPATSDDDDR